MTTLYFMRHSQSEANLADILASQIDFPLTEKGKKDSMVIATEFCNEYNINKIIVSPLLRAQQTALPFEEILNIKAKVDDRLIEQHLGSFSGKTYTELESETEYCHDRAIRWSWVPLGGGESYEMIADRLAPFFSEMQSIDHGNVLIITHAVTMRMIKATLENILPNYPHEIAHNGEIWEVILSNQSKSHEVKSLFYGDSKKSISKE